jgi:hypothetical protein
MSLQGVEDDGESSHIYKQALLCKLIHTKNLCVIPAHWDEELHATKQADDPFFYRFNFFETAEGTSARFFFTQDLFDEVTQVLEKCLPRCFDTSRWIITVHLSLQVMPIREAQSRNPATQWRL